MTVPLSGKVSGKQRRALRARAHHLNPVVSIGAAGASDAVLAELDIALDGHELVKLRIAADDREQRKKLIDDLCRRAKAELIQRIGHTAVIYRERPLD
jgi:RNA-binding protein